MAQISSYCESMRRFGSCAIRLAAALSLGSCAGGQRGAAPARVRSIAPSVPRTSSALIVQKPWSQAPVHREIAARLGLADDYGKALLGLSALAGFDPPVVPQFPPP